MQDPLDVIGVGKTIINGGKGRWDGTINVAKQPVSMKKWLNLGFPEQIVVYIELYGYGIGRKGGGKGRIGFLL